MYYSPFNMKLNIEKNDYIVEIDGDLDDNTKDMFKEQMKALLKLKKKITINMENLYFANNSILKKILKDLVPKKVSFINYDDVVTDVDIEKTIKTLKE